MPSKKPSKIQLINDDNTVCNDKNCRFKLCNIVLSVPIKGAWPNYVGYQVTAPIRIFASPNAVSMLSIEDCDKDD